MFFRYCKKKLVVITVLIMLMLKLKCLSFIISMRRSLGCLDLKGGLHSLLPPLVRESMLGGKFLEALEPLVLLALHLPLPPLLLSLVL
jgi:hypothetical protein